MDQLFFCPQCSADHNDPANAGLGYRLICLNCAVGEADADGVRLELVTIVETAVAA